MYFGAAYHGAMVLFEDCDYGDYANRVLSDLIYREKNKNACGHRLEATYNYTTHHIVADLVKYELNQETIAKRHITICQKLLQDTKMLNITPDKDVHTDKKPKVSAKTSEVGMFSSASIKQDVLPHATNTNIFSP